MTARRHRGPHPHNRFTLLAVLAAVCAALLTPVALPAAHARADTQPVTSQAESMTNGGGCTSLQATRAVYYCNKDNTFAGYNFTQAGRYRIDVTGASSANNTAGISVYIGGKKVAALSFTGTAWTVQQAVFDIATPGPTQIKFMLETDNGSNDTYVDQYALSYEGATPPPLPAPKPPTTGAYASGQYRDMFQEWDPTLSDATVQAKLDTYWNAFFTSTDDTKRLYYPAGSNAQGPMAYIEDTGNTDVRTEGMSYGMMIAVQMDKKAQFDALWNWAKTFMQHTSGSRAGYFCWEATLGGSCEDDNPATDGEEYFATALFFAGHRWGDGSGIYDYTDQANAILDVMLHKQDMNGGVVDSVTDMFDATTKLPVFVPFGSSAQFSDPSYDLPAFYDLWARWADGYQGQQAADRQFWSDAAQAGRAYFAKATNSATGLAPDYAEFTGAPNNTGNHGDFRFDAWRTAVNWSVDQAWWADDTSSSTLTDRLQSFFETQGVNAYVNQYSLSGSPLSSDRSPGLIASNAAASLSATDPRAWDFVQGLWNLQPPTGQYRYYDGLLSFMALLHTSGNFRIYQPDSAPSGPPASTAPAAPSALTATATASATSQITLSWTDNSQDETGFRVQRRSGTGAWADLATPGAGSTTYTDTALTAGTAYTYRVLASNAAGESGWSNEETATAAPPSATRNPYAAIEAESYDAASGSGTQSADGGTVVKLNGAGSYLAFKNTQFGTPGASGVQLRVSTTTPGVNVNIRLGSATAAPVCTVYPDSGGAWQLKANSCYPKPSGTATVYLTVTGPVTLNSLTFTR
ncbi:glycosyl hydrolase family 8 [Streptomyces polygonati]|uniref:Glycosyl hydrolase family 8 n=1 Tax=Streptomyces polygonati TaxID=1617087 RepID=A0ABV8HF79_9ACTN